MHPSLDEVERLRRLARAPEFTDARYTIDREMAHGGMGTVYRAFDAQLERTVAVKVVHPGDVPERLLAEARTLAQLEHPGIVPVHDAGRLADGRVYFVMKFVEGERLDAYAPRVALGERLRVLMRIAEAVAFAHARGIPHRDLKPQNVMVGAYGEVLVLDWGVPGVGTPGWMAPEGGTGSVAADVYALGLMLRGLIGKEAPAPLQAIASRAAHDDSRQRYASADALRQDVERFLGLERVEAYHEAWWQTAARLVRLHRVWVALVAAYVVVRLALIFFARP